MKSKPRWWMMPVLGSVLMQCKGSSSSLDAARPDNLASFELGGGESTLDSALPDDLASAERDGDEGTPGILLLATTQVSDPTTVAVDTTSVYWTSPSAVMKISKTGGQPVVLANASPPVLAVDETSVYYITNNSIMSVPLAGGIPKPLAAVGATEAVVVDATSVYWADNRGTIMKAPRAGGAATSLSFGDCYPERVAIDATFVYWIDCGVFRVPLAGGEKLELSATPAASVGVRIAVDSSGIYFTLPGSSGGVFATALDGGTPRILAQAQLASGLALDEANVYWTDAGMGAVAYVPKSGGPSVVLAASQNGPRAIALDAPYVYVATADAIIRIRQAGR